MDKRLKAYFDEIEHSSRRKGVGFMWVSYQDRYGRVYSQSQFVRETELNGRDYILEGMGGADGRPSILITDTQFDLSIGRVKNALRAW